MTMDGRKIVGSTISEETPIATLLKPIIENGEITDVRTIYHPEYHSKTVEIHYFPYTYWTPTPETTVQASPSAALPAPMAATLTPAGLPATPTTPLTTPNSYQIKNEQSNTGNTDRIFCTVPAGLPTENIVYMLLEHFAPFGTIEYYNIINNRKHKPTFAYIKYFDSKHAKNAYENVHKMWKAVFAKERNMKTKYQGQTVLTFHKDCGSQVEWDTYALHVATCNTLREFQNVPTNNVDNALITLV
ncbi:hypothetical protein TKK_0014614 [Trichogramma kaykai]|uniref:RRM domain-containing protein n=1 Tax=Trichogramma kaykai TaxID=54128 RepID=A0ABD2WDL8_9HYME